MSKWGDLNPPAHRRLAGTIRRVGRPALQRLTSPPGVTVLGPADDIQ